MREIKFEYLFDYEWNEDWIDKNVFTIDQIREWEVEAYLSCSFVTFANVVAIRQWTWLKDKHWKEIFIWDIIKQAPYTVEWEVKEWKYREQPSDDKRWDHKDRIWIYVQSWSFQFNIFDLFTRLWENCNIVEDNLVEIVWNLYEPITNNK